MGAPQSLTMLATILSTHRPYQRAAHAAVVNWLRQSADPCLVTAATGAGKSHLIASLALELHERSGGRVLVLQPRGELVRQNFAKLRAAFVGAGLPVPASIYSASAGQKDLSQPIVYATPQTAINGMATLSQCRAVIIDECHGVTPTVTRIIEQIHAVTPTARVVGVTATPYRLGTGYIYRLDPAGKAHGDDMAHEPFFAKCVYEIDAPSLIAAGYLTPPVVAGTGADAYRVDGLVMRGGRWTADSERAVFAGQGRKTAKIVADIVERTASHQKGLIFCATIAHGHEILESLPAGSAELITGEHKQSERRAILRRFSEGKIKWLVNRDILTTGYDEPAIDHVIFMRHTESAGLMQQMIGRVLRLHPDKSAAYVYDYAGNIDKHAPNGDLFNPEIRVTIKEAGERVTIECPRCGAEQDGAINADFEGLELDRAGYVINPLDGERWLTDSGEPMAGHHTRRCSGLVRDPDRPGHHIRCGHYWRSKTCLDCNTENDIAARYCSGCEAELVDPNDKLILTREAQLPREAWRYAPAANVTAEHHTSQAGAPYLVAKVSGAGKAALWIPLEPASQWQQRVYSRWHDRPAGANALAWRRQKSGDFLELGGWFASQGCQRCSGKGYRAELTERGPVTALCSECSGSGITPRR